MRRLVTAALAIAASLALAACDHPPTKEIAAAEQQVERARLAGADVHAPQRWSDAQRALALARQRLQERDYQGALSAANDASESARLAVEGVGPAKAAARSTATTGIGEVEAMIDRARQEREAVLAAGVPPRTLATLDARVEEAALMVAAARTRLEAEDFGSATAMTSDLRTLVSPLPDLYRDTRAQHEAKRPRPRARRR